MDLGCFEARVPEDCEKQRNWPYSGGLLGNSWENDQGKEPRLCSIYSPYFLDKWPRAYACLRIFYGSNVAG